MDGTIVSASCTSDSEHLPLLNTYMFSLVASFLFYLKYESVHAQLYDFVKDLTNPLQQDPDMTHGPEMENHQKFRCSPRMQYAAGQNAAEKGTLQN